MLDFFRSVEPDAVKERTLKKSASNSKRRPSASGGIMNSFGPSTNTIDGGGLDCGPVWEPTPMLDGSLG